MKITIKIIIATLIVAVFFSCKKDNKILGTEVQPANDVLNGSFDNSAKVYVHTKRFDSTGSFNTGVKFLGANNDPDFGSTNIGLYLNANFSVSDLNFGTGWVTESAEIILAVDLPGSSGDVGSTLSYSVYLTDSVLVPTRAYYTSNTRLHRESGLNKTSTADTSVYKATNVIRIPVDTALATLIMRNPQYLTNNNTFQNQYKAFYIKCAVSSDKEGVVYRCLLDDAMSGFYLRYKKGGVSEEFRFSFSGSSASRFNTVKYDYSAANPFLKSQLQGDTLSGSENIYLKGMGLMKVRVYIPSLKNYSDSFKVAVNRAEVVFNIDRNYLSNGKKLKYLPPIRIALLPVDSLGRENYSPDQLSTTNLGRYDGGYDSDNERYVFNIARYVQEVLSGKKKNYGFYLILADPTPLLAPYRDHSNERVAFYGSGKTLKPTFSLSYIKFPKD